MLSIIIRIYIIIIYNWYERKSLRINSEHRFSRGSASVEKAHNFKNKYIMY